MELYPTGSNKEAYQRDPVKVKEWLTTTFINIKEKAQKLGARIFFAEPRSSHPNPLRVSLMLNGKTPTIFTTGSRLVKNYIAAIANDGLV
jgi:hypothetical protein